MIFIMKASDALSIIGTNVLEMIINLQDILKVKLHTGLPEETREAPVWDTGSPKTMIPAFSVMLMVKGGRAVSAETQ